MNNKNTALAILAIIIGMFCLAFASVPLYDLFCKVTGYGGTTNRAESLPNEIGKRQITILFNADTAQDLPWEFSPEQRKITIIPGKRNLAFYKAKNISDQPITGTATYNITPLKAGSYFSKIECFCFTEQKLLPNQEMIFPVSFFVDPEIEKDPYLKDVSTITLSYSFFKK